jgi:hypothetical protein
MLLPLDPTARNLGPICSRVSLHREIGLEQDALLPGEDTPNWQQSG